MSAHSSIAWTDASWNCVVGCSKVSAGCQNCYAETLDRRFRYHQEGQPYRPWTHPNAPYNVRVFPERLEAPLRWRKPMMIFVNSRSDMFHEAIPESFRASMWDVMRESRRHTFQILTKRPENIASMLPPDWGPSGYPNVWIGVSGETVALAIRRGTILHDTPAVVRFLSAEPWLETRRMSVTDMDRVATLFDWVIIGGESGPHARPMDLEGASQIVRGCVANRTPIFVKQLGGHPDARSHEKATLDGRTWTEMPNV